jgi:hypothetical protein
MYRYGDWERIYEKKFSVFRVPLPAYYDLQLKNKPYRIPEPLYP